MYVIRRTDLRVITEIAIRTTVLSTANTNPTRWTVLRIANNYLIGYLQHCPVTNYKMAW